jgi:hypothetical protein
MGYGRIRGNHQVAIHHYRGGVHERASAFIEAIAPFEHIASAGLGGQLLDSHPFL